MLLPPPSLIEAKRDFTAYCPTGPLHFKSWQQKAKTLELELTSDPWVLGNLLDCPVRGIFEVLVSAGHPGVLGV